MNLNTKSIKTYINQALLVVNEFDPVHLISKGAPTDEYSSEVEKIVTYWLNNSSTDDKNFAENIYLIFCNSFDKDTAGAPEKYLPIAQKLIIEFSNIK